MYTLQDIKSQKYRDNTSPMNEYDCINEAFMTRQIAGVHINFSA